MPKRRALRPGSRGEAIIGALLAFLFGYMAAEALMGRYVHPLHWVAAVVIGVLAYGGTFLWYRWRYPRRRSATPANRNQSAQRRWRLPWRH